MGPALFPTLALLPVAFWGRLLKEALGIGPYGPWALAGLLLLPLSALPYDLLHAFWSFHRLGVAGDHLLVQGPRGGVRRFRGGPEGEVLAVWRGGKPLDLLAGPFLLPLRWGRGRGLPIYSPEEEALLLRLARPADEAGTWTHLAAHNPLAYGLGRFFWAAALAWLVLFPLLAGLDLLGRFLEAPGLFLTRPSSGPGLYPIRLPPGPPPAPGAVKGPFPLGPYKPRALTRMPRCAALGPGSSCGANGRPRADRVRS